VQCRKGGSFPCEEGIANAVGGEATPCSQKEKGGKSQTEGIVKTKRRVRSICGKYKSHCPEREGGGRKKLKEPHKWLYTKHQKNERGGTWGKNGKGLDLGDVRYTKYSMKIVNRDGDEGESFKKDIGGTGEKMPSGDELYDRTGGGKLKVTGEKTRGGAKRVGTIH